MVVHQRRHHLSPRLVMLILSIRLGLLLRPIVSIGHWRHLSSFCVVLGGGTVLQTLCFSCEYTVCVRGTIQYNTRLVVALPTVFFVVFIILSAHLVAALEFTGVRVLVMIRRDEVSKVTQLGSVHRKTLGAFTLTVDSPLPTEIHHLLVLDICC